MEYVLTMNKDTGHNYRDSDMREERKEVLDTIGEVCDVGYEYWKLHPGARWAVIQHLINHHQMTGPGAAEFIYQADKLHIYQQIQGHEEPWGVMWEQFRI